MSCTTLWRATDPSLCAPRRRGPFHITVALGMPGQWGTDTTSLKQLQDLQFSLRENILPESLPQYYTNGGIVDHFEELINPHSRAFINK